MRHGLLVLTVGPVPYFYRRYLPIRWPRLNLIERSGGTSALPSARTQQRDGKPKSHDADGTELGSARRGELNRDRGSRRLLQAVDARRRLNARRADSTRTRADLLGPSDSRYAYLTRSYD